MSAVSKQPTAVPRTLDHLMSPEWLNSALGERYPGVNIKSVTAGPEVSRVSTNARFEIACEGELPEGLSANLCGKGYFREWDARAAGTSEVLFYRHLAEATGVRTLRSVYADVEEETGHGVIITEDVVAQGAEFLDTTSNYTPELTAQSLGELAKMHGAMWNNTEVAGGDWLDSKMHMYSLGRGVDVIRGNFESDIGAGVPDEARDADRLFAAHQALAGYCQGASPWTIIHADTHVGNVYLDGQGRPSFLDWQTVQRGPWYIDIGYHIASALPVEERRIHEKDLLRHYLDQLAATGVQVPSWDDAWLGFRRGIVHGFFLWGITMKVKPSITTVMETRLGTATADHDCFAAVGV